jgi:hypothetical protein
MDIKLEHGMTFCVKALGKTFKLTAVFTSVDETNAYLETHRDEGMVAEVGEFIFVAENKEIK